jgi:ribokinase
MIVVVGSLNMDLVVPVPRFPAAGETLLGGDYARHPGGKGANQAVAAARAGGAVAMVGRVGRDEFGSTLLAALAADGVGTEGVAALADAPTGVAFISVDATGQNTIIVAPGANARLGPADLEPARFAGARVVLLQLEVPLEATLAAARLARAAAARVVLNLAPARPLRPEELADIEVLIINETEAALLSGFAADEVARAPERVAAALTELVPAVVLTLGAAGAAWAEGGATGLEPGFAVRAVDTTAAGDAFVGALAVVLAYGAPTGRGPAAGASRAGASRPAADAVLAAAVRYANAAGALAATSPGAQPSLPTAAAIAAFLEERA